MVDLVDTCKAWVPHLPRLLPPPTLKSWATAMILKSTPRPEIPKTGGGGGSIRNAARSESHCPKPT